MAPTERRPLRQEILDASLIPLERALRARADDLDARHATQQYLHELPWDQVAREFRALADELHHW